MTLVLIIFYEMWVSIKSLIQSKVSNKFMMEYIKNNDKESFLFGGISKNVIYILFMGFTMILIYVLLKLVNNLSLIDENITMEKAKSSSDYNQEHNDNISEPQSLLMDLFNTKSRLLYFVSFIFF